jgi:hypothetical protein
MSAAESGGARTRRSDGARRMRRSFALVGVAVLLVLQAVGSARAASSNTRRALDSARPAAAPWRAVPETGRAGPAIAVRSWQLHSSQRDPIRLARRTAVLRRPQLSRLRRASCMRAEGKVAQAASGCARYTLYFSPRGGGLAAIRPGWHVIAGSSALLPHGLLMSVTDVRRTTHGGLVVDGKPAMINQAIRGRWRASVPIAATPALLGRARVVRGVRISLRPFPAQRALLGRRHARGHRRHAHVADSPVLGFVPQGFYLQLNNVDLGPVPPGTGSRLHLFLTGYATIKLRADFGTDPSGCPHDSCPGTVWHLEPGFSIELQKAQLALGFDDQKITSTWNPSPDQLAQLKSALQSGQSGSLISLTWGTLPLDPIEFVLPIGPVPVPVVVTQDVKLTSDIKLRALFGIQASLDVGFNVGAGLAWVPGTGPFDPGHPEAIGYVDHQLAWNSSNSQSGSLLQTVLAKLGGDPKATTWLLGAALKVVFLNLHYQLQLYGLVGADLELHLPYVNFQATWNINQCSLTTAVTAGVEGELKALFTLPDNQTELDTPLQIGAAWQLFRNTFPAPGVGCSSSSATTPSPNPPPSSSSPHPPTPPPAPPSPAPSPGAKFFVYHIVGSCSGSVCGVNERTGPGYAYPILGTKPEGAEVDIVCQTRGDRVYGTIGGSSSVWDRLTNSYYVSDLFVSTPQVDQFSPPIPNC